MEICCNYGTNTECLRKLYTHFGKEKLLVDIEETGYSSYRAVILPINILFTNYFSTHLLVYHMHLVLLQSPTSTHEARIINIVKVMHLVEIKLYNQ
jgi:hypothetical protein